MEEIAEVYARSLFVPGHLGIGWLGAYAVLSGSPVAAVAMSPLTVT